MESSISSSADPMSIQTGQSECFIFPVMTNHYPTTLNLPTLSFGGYKWCFICRITPSRDILLMLLVSGDKPIKATIGLCLLRKDGRGRCSFQKITCHFPAVAVCRAMVTQIDNNQLANFVIDDQLVVQYFVFIDDKKIKRVHCLEPDGLVQDLSNLLTKSQDISDVTFEVDGQTFRAHRMLLAARSSVFRALLFGPMAEANKECIKIQEMNSEVFGVLLRYIYTDTVEVAETDLTQHLLEAADRYALKALKMICEERLCGELTVDTVVSSMALADAHNCDKLLDSCIEFILSDGNLLQLAPRREYFDFMEKHPDVLEKLKQRGTDRGALIFKERRIG